MMKPTLRRETRFAEPDDARKTAAPEGRRGIEPPPSLVRIVNRIDDPRDGPVREKGSGVLVDVDGSRLILTAAHLFRDGIGDVTVKTQNGARLGVTGVFPVGDWDLAFLATDGPFDVRPLVPARVPERPGEPTIAWGFGPDGALASRRGHVVGTVRTFWTKAREALKTTGRAREGDSGGPVLNRRGELIGILWGTDGTYTYSTCAKHLRRVVPSQAGVPIAE